MDNDYIIELISIIKEESKNPNKEISASFCTQLKNILTTNNNIYIILYHLDEIDAELKDISVWIKLDTYNMIFEEKMYDRIMSVTKEASINDLTYKISKDECLKYLMYGGLLCEIIKMNYYKSMCIYLQNNNYTELDNIKSSKLVSNKPMSKVINDAFINTLSESKHIHILFIQKIYNDAKKYFQTDEIFNDIENLIKDNNIEINI